MPASTSDTNNTTAHTAKTISTDTVAVLVASLMKANPNVTFNYGLMSSLSDLTDAPFTKFALDHKFRAIKRRAKELLEKVGEIEESGGRLEAVPVTKKRAAPDSNNSTPKSTPSKKTLINTPKKGMMTNDFDEDEEVKTPIKKVKREEDSEV